MYTMVSFRVCVDVCLYMTVWHILCGCCLCLHSLLVACTIYITSHSRTKKGTEIRKIRNRTPTNWGGGERSRDFHSTTDGSALSARGAMRWAFWGQTARPKPRLATWACGAAVAMHCYCCVYGVWQTVTDNCLGYFYSINPLYIIVHTQRTFYVDIKPNKIHST